MMAIASRGFDCCGLREVIVGSASLEDLQREVMYAGDNGGALVATTIAKDPYYRNPERILRKAGFKYITRFKNMNSGNTLKLWVMVPKKRKEEGW